MPWVGTELWLAEIAADGGARGAAARSPAAPQSRSSSRNWSPDGVLYFVSDRTGWWNLYRCDMVSGDVRPVCPREAEFGQAQWVFGQSTYAFLSAEQLVCAYGEAGRDHLARLDIATGRLVPIAPPYTDFGSDPRRRPQDRLPRRRRRPTPAAIVSDRPGELAPSRCCANPRPAAAGASLRRYFSAPRHLEFPTEGGLTAFANYYPPAQPRLRRAGRRKAAARRQMPWRPDLLGLVEPQPRHPVLDEPRHRRRSMSITAAAPAMAAPIASG